MSDLKQAGIVGKAVVDADGDRGRWTGKPVVGAKVAFSGPGPTEALTSADGTASTTWILGCVAGTSRSSRRCRITASVTFDAIAAADTASKIIAMTYPPGGDSHRPRSVPPTVGVVDAFNNAKPGVEVTFEVTGGGGNITPTKVTTDANGYAR